MNGLEAKAIQCPHCWEMFEITIDCSVTSQEYVEDCKVCCRPIVIQADITANGIPEVEVRREN